MPKIKFQDQTLDTRENEKVLDAFLRLGITTPFSCRNGVCKSCMQVATAGDIPPASQLGLSKAECEKMFFLPCLCVPSGDMEIESVAGLKLFTTSILQGREMIAPDVYKLLLEPTLLTASAKGQTINLKAPNGEIQYFAITNRPAEDYFIEIQADCGVDNDFNRWLAGELLLDQPIEIQGPYEAAEEVKALVESVVAPEVKRPKFPPPDMVLWKALGEGELLSQILTDFYGRVYADPLLSPYFHGTTMQRSIEKVYSFMYQACTGENTFFGEHPKNGHHWMVISEEIYNYREALMMECHRHAGLSQEMTDRWMAIERFYKKDVIKSEPFQREFDHIKLPLEGFDELVLDSGTVCDGCQCVLEAGDKVKYHLRLGTVYCASCNRQADANLHG